jgi:hypothetical protein
VLRRRVLAAAVLAGLMAAVIVAVPGEAKTKPKYKFTLAGPLHVDWQWPVNPNNRNQRDTGSFDVQSGKGCGTSPSKAIWNLKEKSGDLPAFSFKVDLVHGTTKNPAKVVDEQYGGVPAADVQILVRFGKSKATLVTQPHGDVAGLTANPGSTAIKAKRVKKC